MGWKSVGSGDFLAGSTAVCREPFGRRHQEFGDFFTLRVSTTGVCVLLRGRVKGQLVSLKLGNGRFIYQRPVSDAEED